MSLVEKCDSCGALDEVKNKVEFVYDTLKLKGKGLYIDIRIPDKCQRTHMCKACQHEMISARFAELCGMIAPYQPARVSGFIQGGIEVGPLSKEERAALAVLNRRLLKA